jgi:hypothetical protein
MSEDQQSLEWRLKLLSAAPSWQYSQQDIDKLRAENAELRKLVDKSFGYAYASGITHKSENRGMAGPAVLNAWDEWSAQHPILQHNS